MHRISQKTSAIVLLWLSFAVPAQSQDRVQVQSGPTGQTFLWDDGEMIRLINAPDLLGSKEWPLRTVPSGTAVRVLEEQADASLKPLAWKKVEIIDGELSGTIGWVSPNAILPNTDPIARVTAGPSIKNSQRLKAGPQDQPRPRYQVNNSGGPARLIETPSFRTSSSKLPLLALGTVVESIEERADPSLSFLKWHRVHILDGPAKGVTGWISVGAIDELASEDEVHAAATHIIDNEGTAARIVAEPSYRAAADFSRDLGTAPLGTGVKILKTQPDPALPFLQWHQVEVITGSLKGKTGWVTANVVRAKAKIYPMISIRLRTFIPSPMVGMGFESVFNPALGNIVFGGDDRGFGHDQPRYRSHQNVVINLDPNAENSLVDQHRVWGVTRLYFAKQAVHVTGRPIWWLAPKDHHQRPISTFKLSPTDDNLPINSSRQPGGIVLVHLRVVGANPGEPLSPLIDADLKVYLRLKPDGDVEYRYDITHDGFPAYELYVEGEEVYVHDPVKAKQTPLSLFGSGEFSDSSNWTPVD